MSFKLIIVFSVVMMLSSCGGSGTGTGTGTGTDISSFDSSNFDSSDAKYSSGGSSGAWDTSTFQ